MAGSGVVNNEDAADGAPSRPVSGLAESVSEAAEASSAWLPSIALLTVAGELFCTDPVMMWASFLLSFSRKLLFYFFNTFRTLPIIGEVRIPI
jgi:hypothetical protein